MTTWAQYKTQRDTAITTYQDALATLRGAMIDLLALDAVVANKTINSGSATPIRTMTGAPDSLSLLNHPDAQPTASAPSIMDAVRAQAATYMASATP